MDEFSIDSLKQLLTHDSEVCISLYMPADPAAADETDRIRFKNLLRRAEKHAIERFSKNKSLNQTIGEAWTLVDNDDFWAGQSDGLAVFLFPGAFRYYRLPLTFTEAVSVSTRPVIKPLIPLFMGEGRFFVLALSKSGVRLLDCTSHHAEEVDLPKVPDGLAESLRFDEKRYQLQFHTGTAAGRGERAAMFHGQGVGIDDRKDDIRRYFQDVDKGLPAILSNPAVPLVLAGVDYLLPIFREATTHPRVMDEAVIGNPDELRVDELHAKALTIVLPVLEHERHAAESRYREQAGLGKTAAGVETVVPAAAFGRVETLFVAIDENRPGTFDRDSGQVVRFEETELGVDDLLDLAAAETIRNGGSVYAVPRKELPDAHAAAVALLRF